MNNDLFRYLLYELDADLMSVIFKYELIHSDKSYIFSEQLEFPVPLVDSTSQQRSLRALHLALGISYYKIFMPPEINHPYAMDQQEADFWNSVWLNGLGEFLFVNKIDRQRLAQFTAQPGLSYDPIGTNTRLSPSALLGIGGGKDSIVAGELLKSLDVPTRGFVLASGSQQGQTAEVAHVMEVVLDAVFRTIDPQLMVVQKLTGAYQGHVPISLIFGLVGCALAVARGQAWVVVANEASASIPSREWNGLKINHQWSKSFEFEKQLQAYIRTVINPGISYFSAIRQLTSISVAKLFSTYPQYFEVFTSDNHVFRIDPSKRPNSRWGLESPKSLSSFILLAPWLTEAEMLRIFDQNFLANGSLQELFEALCGEAGDPPLDCVGTVEELRLSVQSILQQRKFSGSRLLVSTAVWKFEDSEAMEKRKRKLLALQRGQAVPTELMSKLTDTLQRELER